MLSGCGNAIADNHMHIGYKQLTQEQFWISKFEHEHNHNACIEYIHCFWFSQAPHCLTTGIQFQLITKLFIHIFVKSTIHIWGWIFQKVNASDIEGVPLKGTPAAVPNLFLLTSFVLKEVKRL